MDENIWRVVQIFMWVIGIQTGILGGIFIFLWNNLSKRIDDLSGKVDRNEVKFNAKLDSKIDPIEKDLIQINTRIAVIESRLGDISTNVTYLMWHQQAISPKEEIKEN
jgi:hypothetical protein